MKRLQFIALALACTLFATTMLTAQIVPNPKKVKRPQYKMSVTQGGKSLGVIILELFPDIAPKHCANFDSLVKIKFYDGCAFHRVIPGFVIQGGDPNSKDKPREMWGVGDPSQTTVPAEFNAIEHKRGILSAARTPDPNSATSQFFICVADAMSLNNQYTVYGQVLSGMEVADAVVNSPRDSRDNPNEKIEMKVERIGGYPKEKSASKKGKK